MVGVCLADVSKRNARKIKKVSGKTLTAKVEMMLTISASVDGLAVCAMVEAELLGNPHDA